MTICTPGCSHSSVRKMLRHSKDLSMEYFSVTVMVAIISPLETSASAMSAPSLNPSAQRWEVDSVIGIGQKRPFSSRMSVHTLRQSPDVMKPASGVKPTMPSMIRSPRSRELTVIRGSDWARRCSSCNLLPCSNRGSSSAPPWGRGKALCVSVTPFHPMRRRVAFCRARKDLEYLLLHKPRRPMQ